MVAADTEQAQQIGIHVRALERVLEKGESSTTQIAQHVASFAERVPKAFEIALGVASHDLAKNYAGDAALEFHDMRELLNQMELWKPMVEACKEIEGVSLTKIAHESFLTLDAARSMQGD